MVLFLYFVFFGKISFRFFPQEFSYGKYIGCSKFWIILHIF